MKAKKSNVRRAAISRRRRRREYKCQGLTAAQKHFQQALLQLKKSVTEHIANCKRCQSQAQTIMARGSIADAYYVDID